MRFAQLFRGVIVWLFPLLVLAACGGGEEQPQTRTNPQLEAPVQQPGTAREFWRVAEEDLPCVRWGDPELTMYLGPFKKVFGEAGVELLVYRTGVAVAARIDRGYLTTCTQYVVNGELARLTDLADILVPRDAGGYLAFLGTGFERVAFHYRSSEIEDNDRILDTDPIQVVEVWTRKP